MSKYRITRPTELQDHLGFMFLCAPDEYPEEDWLPPDEQPNNASVFGEALDALTRFIDATKTEEGKEKLEQVKRNLHVAFERFEEGDDRTGVDLVKETQQMFLRCRKYIPISDE